MDIAAERQLLDRATLAPAVRRARRAPLRLVALLDPLRATDGDHAAALAREEGAPIGEIVARRAALAAFLLDRADEARALLPVTR